MHLKGSRIKYSWFKCTDDNFFSLTQSLVLNSKIYVSGKKNKINFQNCLVSDSIITVKGNGNVIEVEEGVKLRFVNIIVRGNNCSIRIGKNTTFGGARIINVGANNPIEIGYGCMFSDKIEIWASDTHAIYNENKVWINQEKPIIIGNHVWIGSRVTILKGVTIGDNSVVGIESLVTKNVSENVIVAGRPVRVIKENITWTLDYPT